jgi:acetyl-CoA C-acetyltransferase
MLRTAGRHGLIFANGGYATHNHTLVLTREPVPAGSFPQRHDHQAEADALRGPVPALIEGYTGPGVVETYMLPYDRAGQPLFSTVIARTPNGQRFLCRVPPTDGATLAALTSGEFEPVGRRGVASDGADGYVNWRFSASQEH